ncbi:MAG: aldo/keto reductase [Verrucomicrobiota bacterium]|nr:aldo/keto reductase [Verrucomicrobiota bacterium]
MQTRRLGNSDLNLTPVGFGTWAIGGGEWGMGWGPQTEKDSIESILEGLEAGINWIDTAHAYGFGLSEEMVGKAAKEWGDDVIIATKCGVLPDENNFPRRYTSRKTITEEVEASLRRLQVEVIDLYQIHWPEPDENVEEAWQTLLDLKTQGKIRWPGVSNYSVSQLDRAAKLGPISSLQPRYSLLNQQIQKEGQLDWCRDNNCGIVCYSPMESGLLTGKVNQEWIDNLPENDWRRHKSDHPVAALLYPPKLDPFLKLVEQLNTIANSSGHTVSQLAVSWVLCRKEITSAIVGARKKGQIAETVQAAEWVLEENELNAISSAIDEFRENTA